MLVIVSSCGGNIPNSQNATRTEVSAPRKRPLNFDLYIAHDELGDPGSGNMPDEDSDDMVMFRQIFCR